MSTLTYFARSGGCFLAGTHILTPKGELPIELLKEGDKVISFNESTNEKETSTIGSIVTYQRDEYFTINQHINATAEHPFYTPDGIVIVGDLKLGDELINSLGKLVEITSITKGVYLDTKVYNLLDVEPNNNYYAEGFLVH